jgi:hypothetical protein
MAAVYQVPGSGAVEFENDGELEHLAIPHFSFSYSTFFGGDS